MCGRPGTPVNSPAAPDVGRMYAEERVRRAGATVAAGHQPSRMGRRMANSMSARRYTSRLKDTT